MDGDGEKAGAQKPRPSADGGTSDRRTKTEGKKAVRDEGAGEGGREGARLTAIAVASLAPRGNIEREGGAAVTEARRRRKLLLLPGAHSPSSEERKSGMCCNARRRRAGEQPVSSRRQSVAVGRSVGLWRRSNEVAHSPSGAPLANGVVDHQTTSGPPSFPPSLPPTDSVDLGSSAASPASTWLGPSASVRPRTLSTTPR